MPDTWSYPSAAETAQDNCRIFQHPYIVRLTTVGWMAERLRQGDTPIGMGKVGMSAGQGSVVWYPSSNWVEHGGLYE